MAALSWLLSIYPTGIGGSYYHLVVQQSDVSNTSPSSRSQNGRKGNGKGSEGSLLSGRGIRYPLQEAHQCYQRCSSRRTKEGCHHFKVQSLGNMLDPHGTRRGNNHLGLVQLAWPFYRERACRLSRSAYAVFLSALSSSHGKAAGMYQPVSKGQG